MSPLTGNGTSSITISINEMKTKKAETLNSPTQSIRTQKSPTQTQKTASPRIQKTASPKTQHKRNTTSQRIQAHRAQANNIQKRIQTLKSPKVTAPVAKNQTKQIQKGSNIDSRDDIASKDDRKEKSLFSFEFHDIIIPITYNPSIPKGNIEKAILSKPFRNWTEKTSRVFGPKSIELFGIDIESVHIINERVDCINLKVDSYLADEDDAVKDSTIKGTCCLRDTSVGILVELHCLEEGTIWSLLVDQPRLNAGAVSALELPVANIDDDGDTLLGAEIEELNTAIGISFKKSDLINLTQMAYEQSAIYNASGLCPSIGNCSEFIELCYVRKEITRRQLNKMRQRFSEMREGGDTMTLRVVPLEDIWKVSADMKVVCALFLLERADPPERVNQSEGLETGNKGVVRKKLNTLLSMSRKPSFFGKL